jgi:uncharacterized protein with von Willebrand factor type A (vWA) domain
VIRLTKTQITRRDELVAKLEAAEEKLHEAVGSFNDKMQALYDEEVQPVLEAHNDLVAEANELREEIGGEQNDYLSGRSEKWLEGERGQAYQEWIDAWSNDLESVFIEAPEPLDEPDCTASEALRDMPEEP